MLGKLANLLFNCDGQAHSEAQQDPEGLNLLNRILTAPITLPPKPYDSPMTPTLWVWRMQPLMRRWSTQAEHVWS